VPVDPAEVALARAEHHRHDVHGHLVDQAGGEDLAADLPGIHGDGALAGEVLGPGDRGRHAVDEVVPRLGMPPSGLGR